MQIVDTQIAGSINRDALDRKAGEAAVERL
jgi:hypothetical protein